MATPFLGGTACSVATSPIPSSKRIVKITWSRNGAGLVFLALCQLQVESANTRDFEGDSVSVSCHLTSLLVRVRSRASIYQAKSHHDDKKGPVREERCAFDQ